MHRYPKPEDGNAANAGTRINGSKPFVDNDDLSLNSLQADLDNAAALNDRSRHSSVSLSLPHQSLTTIQRPTLPISQTANWGYHRSAFTTSSCYSRLLPNRRLIDRSPLRKRSRS